MWTNYHTHTTFCDGKKSVDEVINTAIAFQMRAIGISSHAPLPFPRGWCMKPEAFVEYRTAIAKAKKTANIEVYAGLEVDFIPGKISPSQFAPDLDYTIGSVHFVDTLPNGDGWEIDNTRQVFVDGLQQIFGNDVRAAISRYFELTRLMVVQAPPDIVGHMDKIKMHNKQDEFFSESDTWYRDQILLTLATIREAGIIVEVNTRGIYQKKADTTYPSPWVIAEMKRLGIPVTLSSDAHHPDDLTNQFPEAAAELLKAGYKKIRILVDGTWTDVPFDIHGIKTDTRHYPVA